jgi:hypothetical protein
MADDALPEELPHDDGIITTPTSRSSSSPPPLPERPRRRRRDDDVDIALESPAMGDDVGMRMLLPVGRSPWAIASGYLGLLSVLILPAPLALITGIIAIVHMRRNPKMHGMGRAIFGIIMGLVFTTGLVAAIAVAMLGRR